MKPLRFVTIALLLLLLALFVVGSSVLRVVGKRLAHAGEFVSIKTDTHIPSDIKILRNLEFNKVKGRVLRLHLLRPANMPAHSIPVVIWIHGGSFKRGTLNRFYKPMFSLIRHGFAVASVDYRLSDTSVFPSQIEDCKAAVRWLRAHSHEYGIDPDRIGACGESAGGYLAAFLGSSGDGRDFGGDHQVTDLSSRVQAVVDYYGPTDFSKIPEGFGHNKLTQTIYASMANQSSSPISELLGASMRDRPDLCRRANPINYITKRCPPFLILHGRHDMTVPLNQSELLHDALKRVGVESRLYIVEEQGHEFSDTHADTLMIDFFVEHLGITKTIVRNTTHPGRI